jgi:predicted RNase H-like HicB family nuclease
VAEVIYRVVIERDESGEWLARVAGVPGCHTHGRTLRQVRARIREALSLWVDDADTADVEFEVRLPAELRSALRMASASRKRAARAEEEARERTARVAAGMVQSHGLSMRDAAELIGLSHQRVQQLVSGCANPAPRQRPTH